MNKLILCECGSQNNKNDNFCSNCGSKIQIKDKNISLPKMLSIKDAYEQLFMKKISISKIYSLIRTKELPHCNLNGRILLDVDKTVEWWNKKLNESIEPINLSSLSKILKTQNNPYRIKV